ncbi:SMI1/KNR4 family protein [Marininema halotolerans]|uniref:SMI1-KNR4 cell-wall n=1 Tax=Marininema halotolerans TaxID=1155944 RepID=A0A1I6ULQ1_9BACL|nr:SMI1/KNR4 family protein [Marininema halotolerans]SFT02372.1 SMI1-KNR4 cell-wall [Marininema halotolerans]
MNKRETIAQMMRDYGEQGLTFFGSISESTVKEAETMLNVTLPESYNWYVQSYGHGGVEGSGILGIIESDMPVMPVVETTLDYRQYGLPQQYVVVEDCDEFIYCLDTAQIKNGECPVINWAISDPVAIPQSDEFLSFLIESFQVIVDNLDEEDDI